MQPEPLSMRLEAKKYLHDITRSAGLALQFVAAKAYLDYVSDPLLRSAVERQMQTVGEALAQLAKIDPDTAARITEHQKIIAFATFLFTDTRISMIALSGVCSSSNCRSYGGRQRPCLPKADSTVEAQKRKVPLSPLSGRSGATSLLTPTS